MSKIPDELKSLEFEAQLLAGIILYPEEFHSISLFISERDFTSKLNRAIFYAIQQLVESDKSLDSVLLTDRVNSSGINFSEEIDISVQDYIEGLQLRQIKQEAIVDIARNLATKTFQRHQYVKVANIAKEIRTRQFSSADEIVSACDQIYHGDRDFWNGKLLEPENIFADLENVVEERGNNPIEEVGLMGPHTALNDLYGSLCRPGNITCITARSAVGKTQFWMDYCIKMSDKYDIPILHLDNGEMSKEELQFRAAAALSGVPIYLIESGQWRYNEIATSKIRAVWPKVKKLKVFFFNVGGKRTEQILSTIQKFYFSKVGRDQLNKMLVCFDYLKAGTEQGNKQEYLLINDFMIKLKNFLRATCPVAVLTSVQANRAGITTNKTSNQVIDDESIVGLADAITHNVSHNFILRKKTLDAIGEEEARFGTHMLLNIKPRFLGKKVEDALTPIKFPDGSYKSNWVNFNISNFNVEEKGTGKDVARFLEGKLDSDDTTSNSTTL